ncbi:MAG: 50S ribosomal protein L3 N(5)-glutamine methyltransferase [Gammaproteobacteria bacterium]
MNPPVGKKTDLTVKVIIEQLADRFDRANLFYGHGTDNAYDEAAALVFATMGFDHEHALEYYDEAVSADLADKMAELSELRASSRKPLAYILNEAWFAGESFYVDERVLVPRSPIAELIQDQFQPWVNPADVKQVLEVGTGSGCIAITCAQAFPAARVTATDISQEALEVATINLSRFALEDRISLQQADLLNEMEGCFDIMVTNPPYVPDSEQTILPDEYGHEPALGLYSGPDGLDAARSILRDAPNLLSPQGILVLEVGAQWEALNNAFPDLPFTWLEFDHGGEGVALLNAADFH